MKRILSILLLFVFLFNIMGYYAAFLVQRAQLKKEMKAFIKSDEGKENLQKLVIPVAKYAASVDFIEENEFIYKDELYDLIKKETTVTGIILYCINDLKEELLIEVARKHFNKNNNPNTSTDNSSSLIENIINEALPENPFFLMPFSVCHKITEFDYTSHITTQYIPVISPPPKA
jgi:hypothetical protein